MEGYRAQVCVYVWGEGLWGQSMRACVCMCIAIDPGGVCAGEGAGARVWGGGAGGLAGDRHSPLADRLAALEVRGQVAHAVHGLHQLPQVRLDLREQRPLGPAPPSLAP